MGAAPVLRRLILLLSAAALPLAVLPLAAQEPQRPPMRVPPTPAPAALCLHPGPAPRCVSSLLLEFMAVMPVWRTSDPLRSQPNGSAVEPFDDENVEFNVGLLFNLSPRFSLGGALSAGTASGGWFDGARLRGRWWTGGPFRVDAEAGVVRTNLGSLVSSPVVGPSVGARLNYRDWFSLGLRWDRVTATEGFLVEEGPVSGFSVVGGANSGVAVASGLVTLIGVAVVTILVLSSGVS